MATSKPLPPIELLNQELRYDPDTGLFWWRTQRCNRRMDIPAGSKGTNGYIRLVLEGRFYLAHRVAWYMHHGEEPPLDIMVDHINRVKDDNRIANLRLSLNGEQYRNVVRSTDAMRNIIHLKGRTTCWRVQFKRDKQRTRIPTFKCLGMAARARNEFERGEPLGLKSAARYGS